MFGIGTVSQTAIDPNYVFTVDTSITESGNTTSDTEFRFFTQDTPITTTGSISWEEIGNPSNNGTYNWDASIDGTSPTITFPSMGVYKITVPNTINWGSPYHHTGTVYIEVQKIIEINNWGNHIMSTLDYGFYRGRNLKIKAQDAPIFDSSFSLNSCFARGIETGSFEDVSGSLSIWNVEGCTDMRNLFRYNTNFNIDVSTWDTSKVTTLDQTFRFCRDFNQNINTHEVIQNGRTYNAWDVSNVTSMDLALGGYINSISTTGSFNQDISNWNISKVTTFNGFLSNQTSFNQDIGNWVPESCSIMSNIFYNCQSFNQNINNWDVSKLTTLKSAFYNAKTFNQPLNNWSTSLVNDMSETFHNSSQFNQPLNDWDTGQVTTMYRMFYGCPLFNQNINSWDTINLSSTNQLFYQGYDTGSNFNNGATPGVSTYMTSSVFTKHGRTYTAWDTRNISDAYLMFAGRQGMNTSSFNADVSNWDTSNIYRFRSMFQASPYFNHPISSSQVTVGSRTYNAWDVSSGTDFQNMFRSTTNFNQPIGNWKFNTSDDITFQDMFYGASSFNQDISSSQATVGSDIYNAWDTKKVTNFSYMFKQTPFNKSIYNWNTTSGSTMYEMFREANSFNQPINTTQVTVGSDTYNAWDVSNVINFGLMFYLDSSFNQNISKWNTSTAISLSRMFGNSGFNSPISSSQVTVGSDTYNAWDVSNVTNFSYMFNISSFNQPIGNWKINTNSDVTMLEMFQNTPNFNQDISSSVVTVGSDTYNAWDTQRVTNMKSMFYNADSFNKPIGNWNTSNVSTFASMFYATPNFNQDISSSLQTVGSNTYIAWDVENVTNFSSMLGNTSAFNKSIRNWNTISGSTFKSLFSGNTTFNQNLATQSISINGKSWDSWDVSNSTSGTPGADLSTMFNSLNVYDGNGLDSWNIESASFNNNFASTTTFSTANYDALLISWANQNPIWSGSINFGNSKYTGTFGNAASASRAVLKNTYNWVITDGGPI